MDQSKAICQADFRLFDLSMRESRQLLGTAIFWFLGGNCMASSLRELNANAERGSRRSSLKPKGKRKSGKLGGKAKRRRRKFNFNNLKSRSSCVCQPLIFVFFLYFFLLMLSLSSFLFLFVLLFCFGFVFALV